MNVEQLIAALSKFDKDLPVAFACTENNISGYRTVGEVLLYPAAFGHQVMIEPE
jgi:hypothetical protein